MGNTGGALAEAGRGGGGWGVVRGSALQTGAARSLGGQDCMVGPHRRVGVCAEEAGVQSRACEEPGGHRAATRAEQVQRPAPKFQAEKGLGVGTVGACVLSTQKRGLLSSQHKAY